MAIITDLSGLQRVLRVLKVIRNKLSHTFECICVEVSLHSSKNYEMKCLFNHTTNTDTTIHHITHFLHNVRGVIALAVLIRICNSRILRGKGVT